MRFLRRHPFPVLARFDRVVAVSFALPEAILRPLIPEGLEADTYGNLGFLTIAMVWTRHLRPAGFPARLGQDFFLSGYRLFTRLHTDSGRRLRGLKIVRSETDKRRMVWLGNLMTGYRYRRVRTEIRQSGTDTRIKTTDPGGRVTLDLTFDDTSPDIALPVASPFPDWRTARRFAGPMPFTFSPDGHGRFVVIEGNRANWTPRPVWVKRWHASIFDEPPFKDAKPILANAFAVDQIDYRWNRGRILTPAPIP